MTFVAKFVATPLSEELLIYCQYNIISLSIVKYRIDYLQHKLLPPAHLVSSNKVGAFLIQAQLLQFHTLISNG